MCMNDACVECRCPAMHVIRGQQCGVCSPLPLLHRFQGCGTQVAKPEWQGPPPTDPSPGWIFLSQCNCGWNPMPECQHQNTVTFKGLGFHEKYCSCIPEIHIADTDICILACSCWFRSLTHILQSCGGSHFPREPRWTGPSQSEDLQWMGWVCCVAASHSGSINFSNDYEKGGSGGTQKEIYWWKDTKKNGNLLEILGPIFGLSWFYRIQLPFSNK